MPKTKISEYSVTNSSNTDIEGINIDEGCAPSGINNAIRELMVHLKEFQTGASGDAFTFAGGVLISGTANTITGNVLMSGTNTITGSTTATFAAGAVGTPSIAAHGDTNTGIFFPAADTIAFTEGGAEAMRIDSSGNVGIGTSSPTAKFHVSQTGTGTTGRFQSNASGSYINFVNNSNGGVYIGSEGSAAYFETNGAERARITSSGALLVGKTSTSLTTAGSSFESDGTVGLVTLASPIMYINRQNDDGDLIVFRQANTTEGSISITGNSTNYNPFLGSHSGALADWSRPEIKIGTVMDTIDELLKYKVVVIDVQEEVPAKEAVLDEEGNEVQPAQEAITQTVQKRISYNGNGAVGSSATVEYEGQEYTGIIHNEREEPLSFNKHVKVKVNDTAASKAVFGVFVGWNTDKTNDGGVYNDMLVGAVGNYVIRMAAGQEPQIGDLVEADGNGCAVVQDDDIIRTKTVAKVTSTIKQVTYDDGSFLVTCVLYCG